MTKSINTQASPESLFNYNGKFRPVPPVSEGLYSIAANPLKHVGGFLVNPSGTTENTAGLTYPEYTKLCIGGARDRMFFVGNSSGEGGTSRFAEANIPDLAWGVDMDERSVGSLAQPYRNIDSDFSLGSLDPSEVTAVIGGMYYHPATDDLHLGTYMYYDAGPVGEINHMVYNEASNLGTSSRTGPFLVQGPSGASYQNAGWWGGQIVELPPNWHNAFGGTHFIHNGAHIAVASRASIGPNFAVIDPANPTAPVNVAMNYRYTYDWSTSLAPLDLEGGGYATEQVWNHLSNVLGAFIIPGTDTLCYIGYNLDKRFDYRGNNIIVYHDYNDLGQLEGGFGPYYHDAYAQYYWLYDLNDLVKTIQDPVGYPEHSHYPYEHGYLDTVGNTTWDKRIIGAALNPYNNLVYLAVRRGAEPRYNYFVPSFEVMEFTSSTPLTLPSYWGFYGDSQTDGREPEVSAHSPPEAFQNIWEQSGFASPTSVIRDGQSGQSLANHRLRYQGDSFAGVPWIHVQESGNQNLTGQTTASEFGDTWEAFMREVYADHSTALISYETAYSFGREAEAFRDWTSYNVELRHRAAKLRGEGIKIYIVETDAYIQELEAQVGYAAIEEPSNPYHYNALGNFMVALAMFKAYQYDVNTLDFSTVIVDSNPTTDANLKAICVNIINTLEI